MVKSRILGDNVRIYESAGSVLSEVLNDLTKQVRKMEKSEDVYPLNITLDYDGDYDKWVAFLFHGVSDV